MEETKPFGHLKDGTLITAESPEVKALLEANLDYTVEFAIAEVLLKDEQASEESLGTEDAVEETTPLV